METNETPSPEPNELKGTRVRDRVLSGLEWVRGELTKFFQVFKLKYDATSLKRERSALYEELGRKTVELLKEDSIDKEVLKPMAEQIETLNTKIEEQQTNMHGLVRTHSDPKPPTSQI